MVEYVLPVVPEPTITAVSTTSGSNGGNGGQNEWMILAGVGLALFLLSFVLCMVRFFPSKNLRTILEQSEKILCS